MTDQNSDRTSPGAPGAARALLVTGTVGVGKTSVADAMGDLLCEAGVPHAVIDLDRLCQSWPAPPDDRFHFRLLLRNLRCVARNYVDTGATRLVLAGVAENRAQRERYAEAVDAELNVCRLRLPLATVRERLAARHHGAPGELRWHLDRSGELDGVLDEAAVADFTVDATGRSAEATARAVLDTAAWW